MERLRPRLQNKRSSCVFAVCLETERMGFAFPEHETIRKQVPERKGLKPPTTQSPCRWGKHSILKTGFCTNVAIEKRLYALFMFSSSQNITAIYWPGMCTTFLVFPLVLST